VRPRILAGASTKV
jgi:hypothetical protein